VIAQAKNPGGLSLIILGRERRLQISERITAGIEDQDCAKHAVNLTDT